MKKRYGADSSEDMLVKATLKVKRVAKIETANKFVCPNGLCTTRFSSIWINENIEKDKIASAYDSYIGKGNKNRYNQ